MSGKWNAAHDVSTVEFQHFSGHLRLKSVKNAEENGKNGKM